MAMRLSFNGRKVASPRICTGQVELKPVRNPVGEPIVFAPAGKSEVMSGPLMYAQVFAAELRNVGSSNLRVCIVSDNSLPSYSCRLTVIGPNKQAIESVVVAMKPGGLVITGPLAGASAANDGLRAELRVGRGLPVFRMLGQH